MAQLCSLPTEDHPDLAQVLILDSFKFICKALLFSLLLLLQLLLQQKLLMYFQSRGNNVLSGIIVQDILQNDMFYKLSTIDKYTEHRSIRYKSDWLIREISNLLKAYKQ